MNEENLIARKNGMFLNISKGTYVNFNSIQAQADYIKNPNKYLLPIGIEFIGGDFVKTSEPATYTAVFRNTLKKKDYIISPTTGAMTKTYRYTSYQQLQDDIAVDLQEFNVGYNPDGDYENEWWLEDVLLDTIATFKGKGYSTIGMTFIEDDDLEDVKFSGWAGGLSFGETRITYSNPCYEKGFSENRCCWNYLLNYMKFSYNSVIKYNDPKNDLWTFDQLKKIAEDRNIDLIVVDAVHKKLRQYTAKGEYKEPYQYIVDEDVSGKKIRKSMCFCYIDGHIYPFTANYQKKLLRNLKTHQQKITTDSSTTKLVSNKKVLKMKAGKLKEDKIAEHEKLKTDYSNQKFYIENSWEIDDWKKEKYQFVGEVDLRKIFVKIFNKTGVAYSIKQKNGIIKEIKEYDETSEDYLAVKWIIQSDPNYELVKPIYDKLGYIYDGLGLSSLGARILEYEFGITMKSLKSLTTGTMITPERPYNATTNLEEVDTNDYDSFNKERIRINLNKRIKELMYKDKNLTESEEPLREELEEDFKFPDLGEAVTVDIRRCYSSILENPFSAFTRYTIFDNVRPYKKNRNIFDKETYNPRLKAGWYFCEEITNSGDYPPMADKRQGWFCPKVIFYAKKAKVNFKVTKEFIPHQNNVIEKKKFEEFVNYVYDNLKVCVCKKNGCNDCGAKLVVNSFIGQLGVYGKERVTTKSFIVSTRKEVDYWRCNGMSEIIISEEPKLYLICEQSLKDNRTGALPIHKQILQEAKVKLWLLSQDIKFNGEKIVKYRKPEGDRIENKILSYTQFKFTKMNDIFFKNRDEELKLADYVKYKAKEEEKRILEKTEIIPFVVPIEYKTDSITLVDFNSGMIDTALENIKIGNKRGDIRIEWRSNIDDNNRQKLRDVINRKYIPTYIEEELSLTQTRNLNSYNKNGNHYNDKKEKDEKSWINNLIEKGQGFRLDGMAGTGKSTIVCSKDGIIDLLNLHNKKFIVTATTHKAKANEAFIKKGLSVITLHSALGQMGTMVEDLSFLKFSGVDYLLVDECSMITQEQYRLLHKIKVRYPKLSMILIGDYKQLPAVEKEFTKYNNINTSKILRFLTDFNDLTLKENRRSGKDGVEMFNLFNDVLKSNSNKIIEEQRILPYKKLDDKLNKDLFKLRVHITFTNNVRTQVNKMIVAQILQSRKTKVLKVPKIKKVKRHVIKHIWGQDELTKQSKYGETHNECKLIAIDNDKDKDFYNNQDFRVIKYNEKDLEKYVLLEDIVTEKRIWISHLKLTKHFDYSYAITAHRAQGSTIKEKYAIWEYDKMDSVNWRYTALSRATTKNDIFIVDTRTRVMTLWLYEFLSTPQLEPY
tara:strand:+ start:926 stop:4924 length:3999 start_codon:yes stop_codon:yes gene_type:complete